LLQVQNKAHKVIIYYRKCASTQI